MTKQLIAMILAGGKGTRLYQLTSKDAKPAVSFGGKYKIIDFPLSNCANSGINTVGVVTQYESINLSTYIGNGEKWGLNGVGSHAVVLPPRQTEEGSNWFRGTADAVYQNLPFLEANNPEHVLILSGDHIYQMDYQEMFNEHLKKDADLTIAVLNVTLDEAKRFGIMSVDENDRIVDFEEKPKHPKSTLASMGIYIFKYKVLKDLLIKDSKDETSEHDFGKNIIPYLIHHRRPAYVYRFNSYWKDVGTIRSLWEANMDFIDHMDDYEMFDFKSRGRIYGEDTHSVPQYVGKHAEVKNSVINQGANILGKVEHSIVSNEVLVEKYTEVVNCVLMPGAHIKKGAKVYNAIVANNVVVEEGRVINEDSDDIVLVYK